jgi:Zn-dependent protease with chaperone function
LSAVEQHGFLADEEAYSETNGLKLEYGFWTWFPEIISSHPNLPKRIQNLL